MRPAAIMIAFVASACVVAGSAFSDDDGVSRAGSDAREYARELLISEPMTARLAAWGLGTDEVARGVEALSDDEAARLASALAQLAGDDPGRGLEAQAMYLALVSQMRDSSLFASLRRLL